VSTSRPEDRRIIVFRSQLRPGVSEEYGPRADAIYELAVKMPGYVSIKDFAAEDGERVAIIEFDSPAHLHAWRDQPDHRVAQAEGRERFYSRYSLQICSIVRESRFDGETRSATPPPSAPERFDGAGGCACGAVRYTVSGRPRDQTLCHCVDCRRACGATPVAWATFRKDELVFTGTAPRERASSDRARRSFCTECGSQLTFAYEAVPDDIDLAVATLDDPEALPPLDHVWVRSKPSWLRIGDDLPRNEIDRSPK
jgi:heme-degrading monooxygenase HmoA